MLKTSLLVALSAFLQIFDSNFFFAFIATYYTLFLLFLHTDAIISILHLLPLLTVYQSLWPVVT